jgi:tetratricopeptide (TPR) repeat protein
MIKDDQYFVDFIGVAAPRSGTTWLMSALGEHPDIRLPKIKEQNFFNKKFMGHLDFKYNRGISYYRKQFEDVPKDKITGEYTPSYFVDPCAAQRIKQHFPLVKIICLLRNPVEIVYSTYLKSREYEKTEKTFELALEKTPELKELGFYYKHLKRFYDNFNPEQIYTNTYEEFFSDLEKGLDELYEFLEVDRSYKPKALNHRINQRRTVRSKEFVNVLFAAKKIANYPLFRPAKALLSFNQYGDRITEWLVQLNLKNEQPPEISEPTREKLHAAYRDDVEKLKTLIGRDLSVWNY